MAHPYAKHAADKVAHRRAKGYQSGGRVAEMAGALVSGLAGPIGSRLAAKASPSETIKEHNSPMKRIEQTPSQEVDAIAARQKDFDRKSRTGGY